MSHFCASPVLSAERQVRHNKVYSTEFASSRRPTPHWWAVVSTEADETALAVAQKRCEVSSVLAK